MQVEAMVTDPYSAFASLLQKQGPGVLGCTLSHLRAIHEAYKSGSELAIIAEDDITPDYAPCVDAYVSHFHVFEPLPTDSSIIC
jgi:hypothetical protein